MEVIKTNLLEKQSRLDIDNFIKNGTDKKVFTGKTS